MKELENTDGDRVAGTTNVINQTDTYVNTGSMADAVEIINHDAAHQNGQGEAAAHVMGKTGNAAFNLGTWANSGDIADAKSTITPTQVTNAAKTQQELLAEQKAEDDFLESNQAKLETQQETDDEFEDGCIKDGGINCPSEQEYNERFAVDNPPAALFWETMYSIVPVGPFFQVISKATSKIVGVYKTRKAAQAAAAIKACFVAGTLIETYDGLKPIETVLQGDLVWSRHEETLEYGYRSVTATFSFEDKEIYEVVVQNSRGNTETFETTKEHPFWVDGSGWIPATALIAGMKLIDRDNDVLTVVSQTKLDKTDTVYNFTVAEFHTYHVGEFGVWVHNACVEQALNTRFSNPNNVHHFIHGSAESNHHWDLLVPDFNENEIKKIALKVLEKGRHTPYKDIDSKILDVTHNGVTKTVQVTYKTNPKTGEIYISNGWVL